MTGFPMGRYWRTLRSIIQGDKGAPPQRPNSWVFPDGYGRLDGASWHSVHPESKIVRNPPINLGKVDAGLMARLDAVFPESGVLALQDATLLGAAGWVATAHGALLPAHSWYGRHVQEMSMPAGLREPQVVPGRTLLLSSDFASGSYGHFLLDCLPRLHLFEQAGFDLRDVDHFYIPQPASAAAQRLMDTLGIDGHKCIWADEQAHLKAEFLFAPTFPGTRRNYPKWVPKFLQQCVGLQSIRPHRRLYISRDGFRRTASNETNLQAILRRFDFEIYKPNEHQDNIRDFSQAAIIVGPHGGALSDVAFCAPGAILFELLPSDHLYPYFYTLAEAAGMNYYYQVCKSETERPAGTFGPSFANFKVDEDLFEQALMKICN